MRPTYVTGVFIDLNVMNYMLRMIRIVITQNIGKCKYQLTIHTNLEHITILAYIQYAQEDNEYAP